MGLSKYDSLAKDASIGTIKSFCVSPLKSVHIQQRLRYQFLPFVFGRLLRPAFALTGAHSWVGKSPLHTIIASLAEDRP